MKTFICIIRHGENDWNKARLIQGRYDIPLNEYGKTQIKETSIRLKDLNISWDVFLSSPLQRAKESCEIIKNELNRDDIQIKIRPDLIEREFGVADGIVINHEVYDKILLDDVKGMEKSYIIQERAMNEIKSIAEKYQGKNILIVSHSHFIKAIFTVLDPSLTFKSLLLNGGLCFIEFEDDKIVSFRFNQ